MPEPRSSCCLPLLRGRPSPRTTCPDPITAGDRWLATWIPLLTAGPDYASGNLLIDVMWDEGRGATVPAGGDCTVATSADCRTPNIVVSPYTTPTVSPTNYSHYSLLRTTERILGLPYLGSAADPGVNDMCDAFRLCAPLPPPTASFTVACSRLSCSTDARSSTAVGSTITDYAWDFGDGSGATGPTATHAYAEGGTYSIALTVTSAEDATGSTTRSVVVTPEAVPIAFRAAASKAGYATSQTVPIPPSVISGDGMLLLATSGGKTLTGPAGWTLVDSVTNNYLTTSLWSKVATPLDAGQTATVGFGGPYKGTVQLLAYAGTSTVAPVAGVARTATTGSKSTATTPTVNVPGYGSWLVSYWAAKSAGITGWTPPTGQEVRGTAYSVGNGRISSLASDGGAAVPLGTAGGLTATTDQPETAGTTWSIVLAAAQP